METALLQTHVCAILDGLAPHAIRVSDLRHARIPAIYMLCCYILQTSMSAVLTMVDALRTATTQQVAITACVTLDTL